MIPPVLKRAYQWVTAVDDETIKVLEYVRRASKELDHEGKVLDVGCGHGRYLRGLSGMGIGVTGIEVNQSLIQSNRREGLRCMTPEEFENSEDRYDVVIMSHIIEHFSPEKLLQFIDYHLDRATPSGHLILATPLMSASFYDDFDHVRPYHPQGIKMVFGEGVSQVQYQARNRLRLIDLWFRRGPFRIHHSRAVLLRKPGRFPVLFVNLLLALAFRVSFGLIGRVDGWVGAYQKVRA